MGPSRAAKGSAETGPGKTTARAAKGASSAVPKITRATAKGAPSAAPGRVTRSTSKSAQPVPDPTPAVEGTESESESTQGAEGAESANPEATQAVEGAAESGAHAPETFLQFSPDRGSKLVAAIASLLNLVSEPGPIDRESAKALVESLNSACKEAVTDGQDDQLVIKVRFLSDWLAIIDRGLHVLDRKSLSLLQKKRTSRRWGIRSE